MSNNGVYKDIAVVFPGQGAQFVGMGKDLYEHSAAARRIIDTAIQRLGPQIKDLCFQGPLEELTRTKNSQVALFVVSYAFLAALRELVRDFVPAAYTGLSLGEITAHTAAGTFSFEAGLDLVSARAAFMDEACVEADGTMASVLGLSHEEIISVIEKHFSTGEVQVANINSPAQIVISCRRRVMSSVKDVFIEEGAKRVIELNVAGPFHSTYLAGAGSRFKTVLKDGEFTVPRVRVASNVTGRFYTDSDDIKDLLVKQISNPVQWVACIRLLYDAGVRHVVELGAGKVLSGLVKKTEPAIQTTAVDTFSALEVFARELCG